MNKYAIFYSLLLIIIIHELNLPPMKKIKVDDNNCPPAACLNKSGIQDTINNAINNGGGKQNVALKRQRVR
jgi:hypothetical protein